MAKVADADSGSGGAMVPVDVAVGQRDGGVAPPDHA
jgi:hypothetical protein